MKKRLLQIVVPWLITIVALYFAFRGMNWGTLFEHIGSASPGWILLAAVLTCASYLLRARRWQSLFPSPTIDYLNAAKVLILGFFMNNILPARTGEFVRAHLGARVTGERRTLVLGTIASERLVDGLTLSIMFVAFSLRLGNQELSRNLSYVAALFGGVTVAVLVTLIFRHQIFSLIEKIHLRFESRASHFTFTRLHTFVDGLEPLCSRKKLPAIIGWSAVIWAIELLVYISIVCAYGSKLALAYCVLFLVTVNFSSLIPAAPGGLGVIEAIGSAVLTSVGVPREQAITMVLTQHVLQYLVVGIPGAAMMVTWKSTLKQMHDDDLRQKNDGEDDAIERGEIDPA